MTTPYIQLTPAPLAQNQFQTVDQLEIQAAQSLMEFMKICQRLSIVVAATNPVFGQMDSTEQVPRTSNLPSIYANPTKSVGDMTNVNVVLQTVFNTANTPSNLNYIGQTIGPENAVL
jgi:hypothetical protein